jgi:hypothetical protein
MANLFDGVDLGGLRLPNRIAMPAMTRTRATEDDMPTDVMRDYYVQRASAGLIITECTQVSDQAHGVIRAPGLPPATKSFARTKSRQPVSWRLLSFDVPGGTILEGHRHTSSPALLGRCRCQGGL